MLLQELFGLMIVAAGALLKEFDKTITNVSSIFKMKEGRLKCAEETKLPAFRWKKKQQPQNPVLENY